MIGSSGVQILQIRGVIKKFSARYALMRFIELRSLSVSHLLDTLGKDSSSYSTVKKMGSRVKEGEREC